MTTGCDFFPNDDFFPDIDNLFIDDMGDTGDGNGSAPAAMYVIRSSLFHILLPFLLLVYVVDWICFSTVLLHHMFSLILVVPVMNCFHFSWIKSFAKLLIYSTIEKPDNRQFTPTGFIAS